MAKPVTVSIANPAPEDCPASFSELITLLRALVSGSLEGDFESFVIGSDTPSVDDQDTIWFKLDGAGRPLGPFIYYGGNWRRVYSGRPNQITMYSGDPAVDFDASGLGIIGGNWDGWALMNGNNGTTNVSDKFVVAGRIDNVGVTGYSGGLWRTNVTGTALNTGGAATHMIINQNLPEMDINITGNRYDEAINTNHPEEHVLIDDDYFLDPSISKDVAHFGADPDNDLPQIATPTVPPFLALAYCQFVGYS